VRAVLLLAHGTPDSLEDMPEYLTRVRGGRPPSPELLAEMRRNYAAIGGRSPLTELTRAQGDALARELGTRVYVGMRNWRPFVADALHEAWTAGDDDLLAIPMAPQFSTLSVEKYRHAVEQATPAGMRVAFVEAWHDRPLLLDAFADKVRRAMAAAPPEAVVFTAHSLPVRVVEQGDPYPEQVAATAAGVAARASLSAWRVAYQSAGRTPEPWLGPTLEQALLEAAAAGARQVLVAPVGFVCDHTEVLYDIDVQARAFAAQQGLRLDRTESLNTSPLFIRALAAVATAPRE
jgi:protoporphyrin/coproporphyrin ferrochelatase